MVGNCTSSIGAVIVSSVVMTGLSDQPRKEKYMVWIANPNPPTIVTSFRKIKVQS